MIKRNRIFWMWIGVLVVVIIVGLYATFEIMTKGLVVTNLTDDAPWGLWIILDLSCIALADYYSNENRIINYIARALEQLTPE